MGNRNMGQYTSTDKPTADEPWAFRERGFSLLEVMIALLVLSFGLLGIAGLQTFSLQFNHQSYERTQATLLISEIFDRIMANPTAARAGNYDSVPLGSPSTSYTGYGTCATTGCATTSQLATYDVFIWKSSIENSKMAQGKGSITRVNPADPNSLVYDISITWYENNIQTTQTMRVRTL
jgi:type IV pilus assembly protein PilV